MKEFFYPVHWLPFIWVLLQAYLMLSMALFILKRKKLLVAPVAGMDYGDVAIAVSILLGVLFISTGAIPSVFQAAKTLQNSGGDIMKNTFLQFTEYFIVAVLAAAIFLVAAMANRRLLLRSTDDSPNDENIPWGILVGSINIGLAIVLWFWLKELVERITPEFVNFR